MKKGLDALAQQPDVRKHNNVFLCWHAILAREFVREIWHTTENGMYKAEGIVTIQKGSSVYILKQSAVNAYFICAKVPEPAEPPPSNYPHSPYDREQVEKFLEEYVFLPEEPSSPEEYTPPATRDQKFFDPDNR